ncbi:23S rRNA G2445 N2-methylase RlmL [Kribbella aluminosa]|uniref:23S rRNA G2445 N2-methylase RlmL n=1 Tax=Kribbella aluminosa TaxID=416017 RepID=A0ABS4UGZ1_9ACTN|nr:methyltransferase domain-containing protein [Kribbella aluminosa]MBP2350915.1 23S rRNA G2445 N2-methylase RlmL [Kribbella aluminosa]
MRAVSGLEWLAAEEVVAAAMAHLADLAPGHDVLDPFCGAGTVLLEAQVLEPDARYVGVDRAQGTIAAAQANASALQREVTWRLGDARRDGGCGGGVRWWWRGGGRGLWFWSCLGIDMRT